MKALSLGTLSTVVALSVAPATTTAQTSDEINGGIQFDFSLPGARSLGMGGAFVALADDATAGYSNPAGLTTSIVGSFISLLPCSEAATVKAAPGKRVLSAASRGCTLIKSPIPSAKGITRIVSVRIFSSGPLHFVGTLPGDSIIFPACGPLAGTGIAAG